MRDTSVWTLGNVKNPQLEKLHVIGLESAKWIVRNIPEADYKYWYVQKRGWEKAKKLAKCEEFCDALSEIASPPFTLPSDQERTVATASHKSMSMPHTPAQTPTIEGSKRGYVDRKHKRVNARFRVLIFFGDKVFRAHSKDISLGGLLLESSIPQTFVGKNCKVRIGSQNQKMNIEFNAELREIKENGTRLVFEPKQGDNGAEILNHWLSVFDEREELKAA